MLNSWRFFVCKSDEVRPVQCSRHQLAVFIVVAAAWGMVVDANVAPVLSPTGNSTLIQASTAAGFATLGALFGPMIGSLGGLLRDGSSFVVTLATHPNTALEPHWAARKAADIAEDVILGLGPGLVGTRTRRASLLTVATAVSAWLSLPFLVVSNTLIAGEWSEIWHVLSTPVGDWDQPADPGLTVYALFAGCMTAMALTRLCRRPKEPVVLATALGATALAMIALGAHP